MSFYHWPMSVAVSSASASQVSRCGESKKNSPAQAKRFRARLAKAKGSAGVMHQAALQGLRKEVDPLVPRVQQVMRKAKQRILGGDTHVARSW